MREQIKLIVDTTVLSDFMEATEKMAKLQKNGYKLMDLDMQENIQSYYLEQVN